MAEWRNDGRTEGQKDRRTEGRRTRDEKNEELALKYGITEGITHKKR